MIEARHVSWAYGRTAVLSAITLSAQPGRVLGLIGPNGSGKTTLLRLLHGSLSTPTGSVEVDGVPLRGLAPTQLARRLAVVVQEDGGENAMSVAETVLLGRTPHLGTWQRTSAEDRRIAADALADVGGAHLARRQFALLSGGERQRVLIARALAQRTSHLLLDEPTNHLDIRAQHEVLGLVRRLATERGTTTVVVLHDLNLAARYCDDLVLLGGVGGGVVASGPTREVLTPALLEPVYGIGVDLLDVRDRLHLVFDPDRPARAAHDERTA